MVSETAGLAALTDGPNAAFSYQPSRPMRAELPVELNVKFGVTNPNCAKLSLCSCQADIRTIAIMGHRLRALIIMFDCIFSVVRQTKLDLLVRWKR